MTAAEFRDQALQHIQRTTITYPAWAKAVKAGRYNPKDGSGTEWGKALAALAQIGAVAPPPPPPPPPAVYGARSLPVGPFTEFTSSKWFRTTAGGTVQKVRVAGAPDYGVALMGYFSPAPPAPSTGVWNVSDVIGELIGATPPAMDGRGEAGLWFGQRTSVRRARGDGTWMGAWIGAQCCDSDIYDLTCAKADGSKLPGTGVYIEHCARRVLIDGLTVRSKGTGVNAEWWYADSDYAPYVKAELPIAPAGKAGSWSVEIRNFDIDTDGWAFNLDAGTCDFHLHDGVIRGLHGVQHPKYLAVPSMPNRIDWATIDFRGSGQRELVHERPIG